MIGNDIVDFSEARKTDRWKNPRFLDIVFTAQEQNLIGNKANAFQRIWELWSAKESVYKVLLQRSEAPFFNPKKLECSHRDNLTVVRYKSLTYRVQTNTTSNYVLSQTANPTLQIKKRVILFKTPQLKQQQRVLKSTLLEDMSQTYGKSLSLLNFKKTSQGVPYVCLNSKTINISLTHHGQYGAYAFPVI